MSRGTIDDPLPLPLPPEVRWYVSPPAIVLFGCQPLVPEPKWLSCSACNDVVEDRPDQLGREKPSVVYCARCDRMSDRSETLLAKQRHEVSIAAQARDDADRERREMDHARDAVKDVVLSEAQRREIWYGYAGSPLNSGRPISGLARIGREFLRRIDQMPDFSLVIDKRGKVVGRLPMPEFEGATS